MPHRKWLIALALSCVTTAMSRPAQAQTAHADFINAQGQKIGTAKLTQTKAGVRISLEASQLPPGTHGIHVHAVGKCDPPGFTTAGGHLNPDMKHHGKENPEGQHAGDMDNIEVGANGKVKTTFTNAHVTLGDGANSLFHPDGTALVIHEKADDYKSDPAGNAGSRIACGVIQK